MIVRKIVYYSVVAVCGIYAGCAVAAFLPGRDDRPQLIAMVPVLNSLQRQPEYIQAQAQQVQTPPAAQVTVQAPQTDQTMGWVLTAIAGIFTALFGGKTLGELIKKPEKPDVGALLNDPKFHDTIRQVALSAVQSGQLGGILQGAAGLIPGGAPAAAVIEPIARRVVLDILGGYPAQTQQDLMGQLHQMSSQFSGIAKSLHDEIAMIRAALKNQTPS